MRPSVLAACGVAPLIALVTACQTPVPGNRPQPTAVAVVGSTTITQASFDVRFQSTMTAIRQGGGPSADPAMQRSVRASVLRSLILDAIIAQEAATAGLAATDAEVKAEVDRDAQNAGGMSALQNELAGAGGSIAQLQDEIRSQVNEARLEDRFATERAAEVEQQLASGTDFATIAQQWSDDSGSSGKGGDLGVITLDELKTYNPAFAEAVRKLSAGEYTKTPIRDSGGYDIIQVYAATPTARSVRHTLVAAPTPYTVNNRPPWFTEALFTTVAHLCQQNQIHVFLADAGSNPCSGAPTISPAPAPGG
jgi:parvulin-like peptidyl-prolyl isomerase